MDVYVFPQVLYLEYFYTRHYNGFPARTHLRRRLHVFIKAIMRLNGCVRASKTQCCSVKGWENIRLWREKKNPRCDLNYNLEFLKALWLESSMTSAAFAETECYYSPNSPWPVSSEIVLHDFTHTNFNCRNSPEGKRRETASGKLWVDFQMKKKRICSEKKQIFFSSISMKWMNVVSESLPVFAAAFKLSFIKTDFRPYAAYQCLSTEKQKRFHRYC